VNRSQQRAWRALGLGPRWLERAPAADVPSDELAGAAAPASTQAALEARPEVDRSAVAVVPEVDRAAVAAVPEVDRAAAVAAMDWAQLRAAVAGCRACTLCESRRQTVFGVGSERASWMLVGEAPGAEEDARGEPFVGQAGQLLDNMLASLRLGRAADVFIANVLKCRPPRNRDPQPDEVERCEPYLKRQIELVAPRIILVMGRFAAQSLLHTEASIASLRGRVHRYQSGGRDIPVVVTYHPAYLLRNLPDKAKAWADLSLARRVLQPR
jgi:DNA polymerase